MEPKQYYCVMTRRFTLRCNHPEWLAETQDFYNKVMLFYYRLFLNQEESVPGSMAGQSRQQALRALEVLTIVGRDGTPVPYPLPWDKVPLYFRRAAINGAVACARACLKNHSRQVYAPLRCRFASNSGYMAHYAPFLWDKSTTNCDAHLAESNFQTRFSTTANRTGMPWEDGAGRVGLPSGKTESFHSGVTYYKGMYHDLTLSQINLKVWTGTEWRWMHCRLKGNFIPEGAKPMSPTVVMDEKGWALLLPVRKDVKDGRKAKQRMQDSPQICSVQFTNHDSFAVAVILDGEGNHVAARFFRGGQAYAHRCREVMGQIARSEHAMGIEEKDEHVKQAKEPYNNRYWMKLKHLRDYYAHNVSRQIIQFCQEYKADMIVLPRYDEQFHRCVMKRVGNWSPLHLSSRVREQLEYKSWEAGIVLLEVSAAGTSAYCAVCGAAVRKAPEGFECPNGHRGNRQINTARNLGRKCLESFGRKLLPEAEKNVQRRE